jgi:flavodoxin
MRKAFKIILVVFLVFVVLSALGLSVVFLDLSANSATGGVTLPTTRRSAGTALVVYDPGLTGAAKDIASKIAVDIQNNGYRVVLVGIKNSTANSVIVNQYNVIVVGGPIYGGKASSSVQSYLSKLNGGNGASVGVFGVGSFNTPNDQLYPPGNSNLTVKFALKIVTSQNATERSFYFVDQLLH